MANAQRKEIVAGNWKMYKTISEATLFIGELVKRIGKAQASVLLAVPFTAISAAAAAAAGSPLVIGAQNMHYENEGPYTGEVSPRMIREAGAAFVILGHSERRCLFGESNSLINQKLHAALAAEIMPILCIGETEKQREQGAAEDVLEKQLLCCLEGINQESLSNIVIAYEPVWAIGTGKTATAEQAQEMHSFCRALLSKYFSSTAAAAVSLLYGGSVKPDNVKELMEKPDVDGVLVGSGSLHYETFARIINYQTI